MSRKLDYIKEQETGIKAAPQIEEEPLEELDKAEVQEDILEPTSEELELANGEKVYLPYDFTLKDIFRNKVYKTLTYFYSLYQSELTHIRGNRVLENTDALITGILFKPSIQAGLEEMLAVVTQKPLSTFADNLDNVGTIKVFTWLIKVLSKKSGISQAPKA